MSCNRTEAEVLYYEAARERFESCYTVQASGCWQWGLKGACKDGDRILPLFCMRGKQIVAHRFSYKLLVGDLSPKQTLKHICGNSLCVNPVHLRVC